MRVHQANRGRDGEKGFRYSIRKYHFGAASVAVAALLFLGNGSVSAQSPSLAGEGSMRKQEARAIPQTQGYTYAIAPFSVPDDKYSDIAYLGSDFRKKFALVNWINANTKTPILEVEVRNDDPDDPDIVVRRTASSVQGRGLSSIYSDEVKRRGLMTDIFDKRPDLLYVTLTMKGDGHGELNGINGNNETVLTLHIPKEHLYIRESELLAAKKEAAKEEIQRVAQEKKDGLAGLEDLTVEEREAAKRAIDQAVMDANTAIDSAGDEASVEKAKQGGVAKIASVDTAGHKKAEAKQAVQAAAHEKKMELDGRTDLTLRQKQDAKESVDHEVDIANSAIDGAEDNAGVLNAKNGGIKRIRDVNPKGASTPGDNNGGGTGTPGGGASNGGTGSQGGGTQNSGGTGTPGNGAPNGGTTGTPGNGASNGGTTGSQGGGPQNSGGTGSSGGGAPNGGGTGTPGNGAQNGGTTGTPGGGAPNGGGTGSQGGSPQNSGGTGNQGNGTQNGGTTDKGNQNKVRTLPNTGTVDSAAMMAAATSALLGLGLVGHRRKKR